MRQGRLRRVRDRVHRRRRRARRDFGGGFAVQRRRPYICIPAVGESPYVSTGFVIHFTFRLRSTRDPLLCRLFIGRIHPPRMIITRTPLRISIGGGGTDLPSYYEQFHGFVIA